jgi:hypothetical protein
VSQVIYGLLALFELVEEPKQHCPPVCIQRPQVQETTAIDSIVVVVISCASKRNRFQLLAAHVE